MLRGRGACCACSARGPCALVRSAPASLLACVYCSMEVEAPPKRPRALAVNLGPTAQPKRGRGFAGGCDSSSCSRRPRRPPLSRHARSSWSRSCRPDRRHSYSSMMPPCRPHRQASSSGRWQGWLTLTMCAQSLFRLMITIGSQSLFRPPQQRKWTPSQLRRTHPCLPPAPTLRTHCAVPPRALATATLETLQLSTSFCSSAWRS